MGIIQNSTNQIIGSVAGAATLGKHISNQTEANKLATISEVDKVNKDIQAINQEEINNPTENISKDINAIQNQEYLKKDELDSLKDKMTEMQEKILAEFLKTGKENFGYKMAMNKNMKRQDVINKDLEMLNRSKQTYQNAIMAREAQRQSVIAHREAVRKMAKKIGMEFKDFKGGNK